MTLALITGLFREAAFLSRSLETKMKSQLHTPSASGHALPASQVGRQSMFLLHPLILFLSVWILSFLLYAMHLSDLLIFTTNQVFATVAWITVPYVVTIFLFAAFCAWSPKQIVRVRRQSIDDEQYLARIEARLSRWFIWWCVLTVVEVAFSGGVPILWLIQGSSDNYATFGLPSLTGFLNSLLMVLALSKLGIYLLFGGKHRLMIPAFSVLWSIVLVSRYLMVVTLIQWVFLWLYFRGVHIRTIYRSVMIGIVGIFTFGYVGDLRSGGEAFRALAQPSQRYPDWLPSGFLWFYIYLTTPLSNLVNTSVLVPPVNSLLFPNTLTSVIPTIIKTMIYDRYGAPLLGGELVNASFNVSTAYVGPFRDYGNMGMVIYSIVLGIIAAYCWRRRQTFRDGLIYTIVTQCLVFSIFTDFLFFPTILAQVFLIYVLFRMPKLSTERNVPG